MPGVHLVLTARCLHPGCDWTPDEADVDRAARRHTGEARLKGGPTPGHPTIVEARPCP